MLPQQRARWAKEKGRAVAGAALAFDDSHHHVTIVRSRSFSEYFSFRAGHFDGRFVAAAKLLTPLNIARPDNGAEVDPLGISADEGLGEDDHLDPSPVPVSKSTPYSRRAHRT